MNDNKETRSDGARASSLDVGGEELRELAERVTREAVEYFERVAKQSVFPNTSAEELARVFDAELPEEGCTLEELVEGFRAIAVGSRQNGHPRMFGYVTSPSTPAGAFANLLASTVNQNVTSWRSAPAPTTIERTVVRWLAEMISYARTNESCGGLLTSGGSMANLNALYVAHRAKLSEDSGQRSVSQSGLWNAGAPMTLYASDQIHLSIPKAADILGIGREQVRTVSSDKDFRIDVRALIERIEADEREGLRPFCIVASAGTVSTGAVDSLVEVARVARGRGLWLHVDGAYGALARLAPSKSALFDGLELADSISLDPHKWLYAPVDCGCLILREPERARAAFSETAEDYIKVYERDEREAFAFWDYGVELSRPFRALKVWAMLRYYGARRVAEAIEDDCALASHMASLVSAAEDFELLAPVSLSICCFRYVPEALRRALEDAQDDEERERVNAQLDELNASIMHAIQRGGVAYLSNAALRGRFALRASITNFRTTRRDIRITLEEVRRAGREIQKGRMMNAE